MTDARDTLLDGVEILDMGVVPDAPAALEAAFASAARNADAIVTSGGVSVGEADFVRALMRWFCAGIGMQITRQRRHGAELRRPHQPRGVSLSGAVRIGHELHRLQSRRAGCQHHLHPADSGSRDAV